MNNQVAVTILCHNYGRYLPEAVESVLAQSHAASEILIVNDASDDNTAEVASRYVSRGVQYARIDERNQHEGRRLGYRSTSAPLLMFLDADDYLDRDYLANAVAVLEQPVVSVAFSDTMEFHAADDTPHEGRVFKRHRHKLGRIEYGNFIHAGAVVRRSVIAASRVLDFPLPNANQRYSDWWLWRHALHGGGLAKWSPGLYYYRKHDGSVSCLMNTPHGYRYCRDLRPCWEME